MEKIDIIPLECPNPKCRKLWRVPISRLDRQLVCKKCKTEFYVNQTGGAVIAGKRPPEFIDPLLLPPPNSGKRDFVEKAFHWWDWLPDQNKKLVKLVAFSPLIGFLIFKFVLPMLRPGPVLPTTLNGRATMLIKALSKNDMEKLTALTSDESYDDLQAWMKAARPADWPASMPVLPIKSVDVLSQEAKQKRATVEVVIDFNQTPPPPPPDPEPEPEAAEGTEAVEGPTPPEPAEAAPEAEAMPAEAKAAEAKAATPAEGEGAPAEGEEAPAEKAVEPEPPKPPPTPPLKIRLFWTLDDSKNWRFNATETLKKTAKN